MRIFAAIDLSDRARAAVADVQAEVVRSLGDAAASLKVVRPDHLHLTLAFAAMVTEATCAAIVEHLGQGLSGAPFELVFAGIGTFPPRGLPRVLWLGVREGADAATSLSAAVTRRFEAAGAVPDRRPFHPHLTLGRWRVPSSLARPARAAEGRVAAIEVAGVTLYQSRLSSLGPAYTRLAHTPLTCLSSP